MGLFSDGLGIGDVLGVAGDVYSAQSSAHNAREMQKRQLAWERERATHAHQWEVEDLKAAGLNPILSAGGSGAQTGGISAPTVDTSGYGKVGDTLQAALTRAIDAKKQQKDAELIDAEIEQKGVQNSLIAEQALTEAVKRGLINKQTATEVWKRNLAEQQTKQIQQAIEQQRQKFQLELNELQVKIDIAKAEHRYKDAQAAQEEYNKKHQALTYWNSQVYTATKSIQNVTTGAAALMGALNPGKVLGYALKGLKNVKEKPTLDLD